MLIVLPVRATWEDTFFQGHSRLRCQGLNPPYIFIRKWDGLFGFAGFSGVHQLDDTNDFLVLIFHRNQKHGLGMIAEFFIKLPWPGKIVILMISDIWDVDGLPGHRDMR